MTFVKQSSGCRGTHLDITENTVKYHLRNSAQVAAYAVSKGLTPKPFPKS